MSDIPYRMQAGMTSSSGSRSSRLYSFCTVTNPPTPSWRATVAASSISAAVKFEHPISRTLPASTSFDIPSRVSASGVCSSGSCRR